MSKEATIDFGKVESIENLPPVGLLSADGEELCVRRYNLECGVPYFLVMEGDEEYVGSASNGKFENITADGLNVITFPAEECWPSDSFINKTVGIEDKRISLKYEINTGKLPIFPSSFSYNHNISEQESLNILGKVQPTTMKEVALHISSEKEMPKDMDHLYCECVIEFRYNQSVMVTDMDIKGYEDRFHDLSEREQNFLRDMYECRFPEDSPTGEDFVEKYHKFRNMQIEEMLENYDLLADIGSHQNQISFEFDVSGKLKGVKCETENYVFFEYLADPEELSKINKGLNLVSYQELSDPEVFSIINKVQGKEINYLPDSHEAQILTKAILGHDAEEITVNTKDMLKVSFESVIKETDIDPMDILVFR